MNCTALSVGNATVTPSGELEDGDEVHITCDSGYYMSSGDGEMICHNGAYSGTTPTCEEVVESCPTLTIANGAVSGATQPAGDGELVTVTCDSDYEISGESILLCNGT